MQAKLHRWVAADPGRHSSSSLDLSSLVAYLAGPGGRHITGTTITVDGGMNA